MKVVRLPIHTLELISFGIPLHAREDFKEASIHMAVEFPATSENSYVYKKSSGLAVAYEDCEIFLALIGRLPYIWIEN